MCTGETGRQDASGAAGWKPALRGGSFLPPGWLVTNGIGYSVEEGKSDFVMPSRTFSERMTLTAAGVTMELIYSPARPTTSWRCSSPTKRTEAAATRACCSRRR
jgi:hypothetical protein